MEPRLYLWAVNVV